MYHRVSRQSIDPWGLAVRPEHFREHIELLRRTRTPLSMPEFVRRLGDRTLPSNAVAVTFDDGYLDNLREAYPQLAKSGVAATVFLTTGAIGEAREFWWDELARGILGRPEALDCELTLNNSALRVTFDAACGDELRENSFWRAWQEPRTARQRAYRDVWGGLRDVGADRRESTMQQFRRWCNLPPPAASDLPMRAGDVAQLTRDGLVDIGGHTMTHPRLTVLDPAERRREIEEGKRRCEELVNRPVAGFAYPHGAEDAACRAAVRESGFSWACATANGFVQESDDLFALPRFFVQDLDASTFEAALR